MSLATRRKQIEETRGDSAVDIAAQALREIALTKCEGDFLGSEDDLVARLGVSKPTLRQASARVAQEHLIRVRRGVGGGYFARRPGSLSVSRMAAVYLRSRNATYAEITTVMRPIQAELVKLAAENTDPEMRARLREFAEEEEAAPDDRSIEAFHAFLQSERKFVDFLSEMAGNNFLQLMHEIMSDFALQVQRNDEEMFRNVDRMKDYRKLRARLARAIANGDGDIAELLSNRCTAMMSDWMRKGLKDRSFEAHEIRSD